MAAALPWIMAGASAIGSISSARAQKQAGEQEQIGFNLQAAQIERQGIQEEEISRTKLKRLLATQRAAYAKAGVDISSGSPLTILAATAAEGEKEALNIRMGTEESAEMARFSGRTARSVGESRSKATLLGGLGSAGSFLVNRPKAV